MMRCEIGSAAAADECKLRFSGRAVFNWHFAISDCVPANRALLALLVFLEIPWNGRPWISHVWGAAGTASTLKAVAEAASFGPASS
jgi:hypothetical protein